MNYVDALDLTGKTVFIRADLDVPLDSEGNISDDHRIQAALPTIKLVSEKAKAVIIGGHMGRPKGARVAALSLKPVAVRLSELLGQKVKFCEETIGEAAHTYTKNLAQGDVCLLENLRYYEGEESNNQEFAQNLSQLADVYINNAFATAHRAHASTAGAAQYFEEKAAGLTLKQEIEFFNKALQTPERPLVVVFGGAKVSSKIKAIQQVAKDADAILVGGAMANTFLVARGHSVGNSLYEEDQLEVARQTEATMKELGCKLLLPTDVVVAQEFKGGIPTQVVSIDAIPDGHMALDIGPESIAAFRQALQGAKTIVWNGPMGAFEMDEYSAGTYAIVDQLTALDCLTVVGGGDTDLALHKRHATDKVSYLSTGGGAFLSLLEGKKLPALEALSA